MIRGPWYKFLGHNGLYLARRRRDAEVGAARIASFFVASWLCVRLFLFRAGRRPRAGCPNQRQSVSGRLDAWVKNRFELIVDDLRLIICSVSSAFLGVLCGSI